MFEDLPTPKKKKVDYEALHSPLNRIPGIDLATVRNLLDLGVETTEELRGRSPDALFEDIKAMNPATPEDRLYFLRLAVYFAETDDPEPALLHHWKWQNPYPAG